MSGIRIREARASERHTISLLWQESIALHQMLDPRVAPAPDAVTIYSRHIHDLIQSRDGLVLVAENQASGEIVGYLCGEIQERPPISRPERHGFISDLYVQEAWRRQGVATALFAELRLWCKLRRAASIELYISEHNADALAFWQTLGFNPFLKLVHLDL